MARALIACICIILASCATPMPPTGGQPLKTPPSILSTSPAQGATRVDTREVRFDFNRFMNRGSASRAVRVEPDVGIPYTIDWKRKSMRIKFERSLPDSVTVIVSLGTDLADIENNRLVQPFQLAFSTGERVDSAGVDISTVSFDKVRGEEGLLVGLFRGSSPDDAAVYVAESDTSGLVRFRHATPGIYRAVLFDDRNRNRRVDGDERHAFIPSDISVDSDSIRQAGTLVYAVQDTISPSILGVGMLSNIRMRVRFSEPVRLSRSSSIEVVAEDSTLPANWLYSDPSDASVAFAEASAALQSGASYQLRIGDVGDLSGNLVSGASPSFLGSGQADTTRQRLIRIPEPMVIFGQDSIMAVYSKPVDGSNVIDSLIVVDGEQALRSWSGVHVENNRLYIFREGGWRAGQSYQLRLWDPQIGRHQQVSFRPLGESDFGSVELIADSTWAGNNATIEVVDQDGELIRRVVVTETTVIDGLVPGSVSIRAWIDTNNNGRWDGGRLIPVRSISEPVFVQRGIPVSARLTSAVRIKFD